MIIQGEEKLEVGKRYIVRICDSDNIEHRQVPILVLNISIFKEWINFCRSEDILHKIDFNLPISPNFYEVSTD